MSNCQIDNDFFRDTLFSVSQCEIGAINFKKPEWNDT